MTDAPSIGLRIKRARERRRWTQRQLADALGVNIKTVDNYENDRTKPRNSTGAIEEVLGISLTPEPGPEPELVATDEWERSVLDDRYLSDEDKRLLISSSRDARAEAVRVRRARRQQRAEQAARSDADRSGRRTSAG